MKRIFMLAMLFLFACELSEAQVTVSNIAIKNQSFELPVNLHGVVTDPPNCGTYEGDGNGIPGWIEQHIVGGSGGGIARWTCQSVPDGSQAAYLGYGMRMVQDLGVQAQAGIYTLKFYVANWFLYYPGPYVATIWVGGLDIPNNGVRYSNQICTTTGFALYEFEPVTLTCLMPSFIAPTNNGFGWQNFNNGDLVISFDGNGWPVLFDNVSLTFTPN